MSEISSEIIFKTVFNTMVSLTSAGQQCNIQESYSLRPTLWIVTTCVNRFMNMRCAIGSGETS